MRVPQLTEIQQQVLEARAKCFGLAPVLHQLFVFMAVLELQHQMKTTQM
jgi:hypothetical protein